MNRLLPTLLALLLLETGVRSGAADTPALAPFPDNTRYAAIGDSITQNGWYGPYIDLYYLTRFPKQKLDVFNCGINGDTADGGTKRYSWDITPTHPTVASVMFGMNDVGRDYYAEGKGGAEIANAKATAIDNYERNLRELVKTLQQDKIAVTVILPTIFDDTTANGSPHFPGLNDALGECAARAQKVADETDCPVIDFYHPMLKVTQEHQATDPAFSMIWTDRTHPTQIGQLFMAYLFLKAQHVPAEVASVNISGTIDSLRIAKNCQVDKVEKTDNSVSFRYTANALPFPVEDWTSAATKWAPFVDDLDQEIITVTDLAPGNYQLTIDDQPIRIYSADELKKGVNIATENKTPQVQQALKVWAAYKDRQDLVFKLRTIACVERSAFAPNLPHSATLEEMQPLLDAYLKKVQGSPWEKGIDGEVDAYRKCKQDEPAMRAKIDSSLPEIRALAQPVPHMVKISPAPASNAPAQ